MTYSIATLEVSRRVYSEITGLLRAAGYGHAFSPDGTIDMQGIGIVALKDSIATSPPQYGPPDVARDSLREIQRLVRHLPGPTAREIDQIAERVYEMEPTRAELRRSILEEAAAHFRTLGDSGSYRHSIGEVCQILEGLAGGPEALRGSIGEAAIEPWKALAARMWRVVSLAWNAAASATHDCSLKSKILGITKDSALLAWDDPRTDLVDEAARWLAEREASAREAERGRLECLAKEPAPPVEVRPLDDYHEDFGEVLWWTWEPMTEPPYVGSPLDSDWPGYHEWWTPLPAYPTPPPEERTPAVCPACGSEAIRIGIQDGRVAYACPCAPPGEYVMVGEEAR